MHVSNVIEFPRHGGKSVAEQLDVASTASAGAILAAVIRKYGDVRLTTDEIDDARGWQPQLVYERAHNEWRVSLCRNRAQVDEAL